MSAFTALTGSLCLALARRQPDSACNAPVQSCDPGRLRADPLGTARPRGVQSRSESCCTRAACAASTWYGHELADGRPAHVAVLDRQHVVEHPFRSASPRSPCARSRARRNTATGSQTAGDHRRGSVEPRDALGSARPCLSSRLRSRSRPSRGCPADIAFPIKSLIALPRADEPDVSSSEPRKAGTRPASSAARRAPQPSARLVDLRRPRILQAVAHAAHVQALGECGSGRCHENRRSPPLSTPAGARSPRIVWATPR